MRYSNSNDFRFKQDTANELNRLRSNNLPTMIVTAFTVKPQAGTWGATVEFTLGSSVDDVASLRLLRNGQKDYSSAKVLQTWPTSTEDAKRTFHFDDFDKSLTTDQYYWVEIIPLANRVGKQQTSQTFNAPIYAGPQTLAALNTNLLPPDAIVAFSVSLSARTGNPAFQTVYCNFQKPSDPNFASLQIRAANYDGNPNTVAVAQSSTSPFSFNLLSLGENITLYATAISVNGVAALTSPTVAITTSGGESVPAANESLTAIQIIGGNQISWTTGLEPDISAYHLYRNTANNFGTATPIHTFNSPFSNVQTYTDTGGTANSYYWVDAVNPIGTSAQSNTAQVPIIPSSIDQLADGVFIKSTNFPGGEIVVENGNFEADPTGSALPVVPGWNPSLATLTYLTGVGAQSGTVSLQVAATATFGSAVSTKKWRVTPGEQYKISCYMKSDGVGTPVAQFNFIDKNGAFLGAAQATNGTNTTWTAQNGYGTVPANAIYAYVSLQNNTSAGSGLCFFDNVWASRSRSTDDEIFDGVTTYRNYYITIPVTEQNGIFNGGFEDFPTSQTVANGWTQDFETSGSGFSYVRSATASLGTLSQGITNSTGGTSIASRSFGVLPNATYIFEFKARSNIANPGTLYGRVLWYSDNSAFNRTGANLVGLSDIVAAGGPTSANVYQSFSGSLVVPATAKYARVALYNWTGTSNTMLFDQCAWFLSQLNPANGVLKASGSIPPSGTTALTYTNTASSITFSWTGLTVYRVDGTTTSIPNGSQAITGLAASSTYYFYVFWNDLTLAVQFVAGPRGSPAIAYLTGDRTLTAAQSQANQSHIPLSSGPVSAATTASGTGGGGSVGGGGCPDVEMYLSPTRKVKDIVAGMPLDTLLHDWDMEPSTGKVESYEFSTQICIRLKTENGCELILSENTPVPTKESMEAVAKGEDLYSVYAFEVKAGDHVITDVGYGIEFSPLTAVENIGKRMVCRVSCGGRNFACGADPSKRIYTHNLPIMTK